MEIKILYITPIDALISACAMPYQSKETRGLVKRVWDSNHRSIARHGMAAFLITNVSQSLLRQISRHPFLNLTVKSSRYCDMSDASIYMPDKVKSYDKEQEYNEDMNKVMDIYKKWKSYEDGKKEEDVAKMFLPLASTTDLVLSGNFQALYEFLQLRNCKRAEREIHELSLELTKLLKGLVPEIFGELDCKGKEFGICPESFGSCHKYPTKKECKVVKVGVFK